MRGGDLEGARDAQADWSAHLSPAFFRQRVTCVRHACHASSAKPPAYGLRALSVELQAYVGPVDGVEPSPSGACCGEGSSAHVSRTSRARNAGDTRCATTRLP